MYTILDLGKELKKLENFDKDEYIAKLEKEVARFIRNADLHVINHQNMYAELRAALHSLWMTRAERAQDKTNTSFDGILRYRAEHPNTKLYPSTVFMPIEIAEWVRRWQWAERKCLQKAKEFANA